MWLFTTLGFFSIVEKPPINGPRGDTPLLSVRARVAHAHISIICGVSI